MYKKTYVSLALGVFAVFASFAGAQGEAASPASTRESLEVTHKLGTVSVPLKPQRVVVFNFDSLEILGDLGVDVAAVAKGNLPPHLKKYEGEAWIKAGTIFEPDYEALYRLKPELILISDRQASVYAELAKIAPVVYTTIDVKDYSGSFQANLSLLGRIFGQEAKARQLAQAYTTRVEAIMALVRVKKPRTLVLMVNQGAMSTFGSGSRFGYVFDEFAFPLADPAIQASTHGQTVGFEYVAEKNPELILVLDRGAVVGGTGSAPSILASPLVQGTRAAQNGRVIQVDTAAWYLSAGGTWASLRILEDLERALR